MRIEIDEENREAEALLPSSRPDGSGIGVNYTDAYIKALNVDLENGPSISCRRRGLKITWTIGNRVGEGLLRRLEYGPDVKLILREALLEAARSAEVGLTFESGKIYLSFPDEQEVQ